MCFSQKKSLVALENKAAEEVGGLFYKMAKNKKIGSCEPGLRRKQRHNNKLSFFFRNCNINQNIYLPLFCFGIVNIYEHFLIDFGISQLYLEQRINLLMNEAGPVQPMRRLGNYLGPQYNQGAHEHLHLLQMTCLSLKNIFLAKIAVEYDLNIFSI